MSFLDPRAAKVTFTVLLVCAGVLCLVLLYKVILVVVFAILLAYLLSPIVDFVDRFVGKGKSRTVSLAVVYLLLLAVAATAITLIAIQIIDEATILAKTLPAYLNDPSLIDKLPIPDWLRSRGDDIVAWLRLQIESHSSQLLPALTRASRGILSAAGNVLYLVLLPILSFFLLRDGKLIRQSIIDQFARLDRRALIEDILADIHLMLVQYMRALLLTALSAFLAMFLVLHLMGVRYALLLSTLVGAVEIIPVVGPLLSTLTVLAVPAFAGYPHLGWLVAIVLATRLLLDNFVQPLLMSQGVALHPMVIILGAMAGEKIAGMLGIFLSIPVLAVLRIVVVRYRRRMASPTVTVASS
jgi:predicted PurR-regulated permease PerM